jgi:hypothetical protein
MSAALRLYFVAYTSDGGDNFDHFVWAHTPSEAVSLWKANYWDEGECCVDDQEVRVYKVDTPQPWEEARVLEWHADIKSVL